MATGRLPDPNSSPLTAKGDLYTYSTVPAKLAVGNNGETLVADSSATTGLRWTATPSASNPLLNSAMDIWQRGTSVAVSGSAALTFAADRWGFFRGSYATGLTVSRQATGDSTNLPFIQYGCRVQRDSGNTSTQIIYLGQNIESVNSIPFAGKTITLSFYAKAGANYSPTSSALSVTLISGTGTDQSFLSGFTGSANVISQTATLTTTYQRFTYTGTVASTATQLAMYFSATPTGTASTNDWFEVTGVQIDVGSVALPFRRAMNTLAGELAACQRYYWRSSAYGSQVSSAHGFGTAEGTGTLGIMVKMPVTMRVTPTAIDYASIRAFDGANLISTPSSIALITNNSNADQAYVTFNKTSSFTQYRPYFLLNDATTSGYIGFTAEL